MKRLLGFALAVAMIATACSDETTNPTPTDSYVSGTAGSYTIFNLTYIEIDTNGVRQEYPAGTDSVVAGAKVNVTDGAGSTKMAVPYVHHDAGTAIDTAYFAEDGAKMYVLYDLSFAAPGVAPVELGTRWVLIADQNATGTFTGLDMVIEDITIDYNGTALPADVAFKITGQKKGSENLTIGGKSVSALRYENTYGITITVTVPIIGAIPIPINVVTTAKYGKGIGLVYEAQEPTPIAVPQLGFDFTLPGYRAEATAVSN